ncbi:MarR family winged helix-turn-helix transcriptional regulator [Anaeromassilibacillus sp. An200]|uniref:MarR family transcriptional regulator n=1 Tax=Candidatus Caccousia stercoris TaxID=2840723 RepID=A0A9D1K1F7_9FIRM|nr:helix-turn-helix domain-containing protein [Anaeromassilibacillus sp. An200]OUP13203.1 hypothetical protein B5F35_05445 [Anaeromassilibacillus sp. An200]HIS78305.1 MarR family transcriptional regulator [Candidatus Caccousia stercoris]
MDVTERRITRIARGVGIFTHQIMRRMGIGPSELDVLLYVRWHPGTTMTELCRRLEIDKGAAARQLASLQAKGYLRREPNPADGRSQLLFATEKGDALRSSKQHLEELFYEWLLEPLSEEEQKELARLLEIVERRCWEERQADFPHVRERFLEEEKRHAEQEPQPEKKGGE